MVVGVMALVEKRDINRTERHNKKNEKKTENRDVRYVC